VHDPLDPAAGYGGNPGSGVEGVVHGGHDAACFRFR
jgi:hypothetical protein